jgi:PAS domain S-box-containing protein
VTSVLAKTVAVVLGTALPLLVQFAAAPRPAIAPFAFFFLGVTAVSLVAGRWPGFVTLAGLGILGHYLFVPEYSRFSLAAPSLQATGAFLLAGAAVVWACSEFHRTLRKLELAEGSFRELADAMPQLVWTARPDGTVDYYNQRSREYSGFEHRGPAGWEWASALHPDDRERSAAAWRAALLEGTVYECEHRARTAGGTYRWLLSRAIPVRDEQGRVVRWYGTATDIEDQKRTQEALREADHRKDEFLALLGHELRNPLAPVSYALEILEAAPSDSASAQRARDVLRRQTSHLSGLVDDLLDVSRITRGKVHLQREVVDLGALAGSVVEDHRAVFEAKGVRLTCSRRGEEQADEIWVVGDSKRLSQIISNLLQNAAKFTPEGGSTHVEVGLDAATGEAILSVADTGAGIPAEVLPRIFEPFAQGSTDFARSSGGLGLGLALIRGLVELHHGRVDVTSAGEGRGSTFSVRLPRAGRSRTPRVEPMRLAPDAAQRRILIIEDNADAATTLREALELHGYQAHVEPNGTSGIEWALNHRPEVVLCDLGLPDLDGYEVARRLRADPRCAGVRLIALSGYAQPADVARAAAAGFDRHLAKPASLDAIAEAVRA